MLSPEAFRKSLQASLESGTCFNDIHHGTALAIGDSAAFVRAKVEEITAKLSPALQKELRFPATERRTPHLAPYLAAYEEVTSKEREKCNGSVGRTLTIMEASYAIARRAQQIIQKLQEVPACAEALQKTYTMTEVFAYETITQEQRAAQGLLDRFVIAINALHHRCAARRQQPPLPHPLNERIRTLFFAIQDLRYGRASAFHTLESLTEDVADIEREMEVC